MESSCLNSGLIFASEDQSEGMVLVDIAAVSCDVIEWKRETALKDG